MKNILIPILIIITSSGVFAQHIQDRITYPDTLWAKNDTFYVKGLFWDKEWSFSTMESDTIDLGTDGYEGMAMKIWTDTDTLNIPYVNTPDEQWLFVPIASSKDTAIYRLRFNPQNSVFTQSYINLNIGSSTLQIPEVYELANIILFLSDCSQSTQNHPTDTDYSKRVKEHFDGFRSHPLIQILTNKCSNNNHWSTYYGFRENSICFEFDEENILRYTTPYKHVWWDNSHVRGGEFRNLLYLTQDFAKKTDFRTFYKTNTNYYHKLENRQLKLQPINKMWEWIEKEFPQRYDHYKIIFSPLIIGSHSTQQFYKGDSFNPAYQECLMFVNSSESLESNMEYSERLKEGLFSGIVFTEIDHNYVNPSSKENIKAIKKLIASKDNWASKEVQQNYSSEYSIFNEYMTHSIFCLYVEENYLGETKKKIIEKRIQLMGRRGFPKFNEFNNLLVEKLKNRSISIYEQYAILIEAIQTIK